MQSDDIPIMTEEVFLILRPTLPPGTYISSAFRNADYQLRVIREKAKMWNEHHPRDPIPLPGYMSVEKPHTWAPTLIALRGKIDINAPYTVVYNNVRLPVSPHSAMRAVFDLAHPDRTEKRIKEILICCIAATRKGLLVYRQLKPETRNGQLAVHVDVQSVSSRALDRVRSEIGWVG
jgi:hypothetical protein